MKNIPRHTAEIVTAALIGLFSAVMIYGSLQLETGWGSTGPQSGYFPLRLGILLSVVSLILLIQAVRSSGGWVFVTPQQLKYSLAVFIPTVFLVMLMPYLGAYVPSVIYLTFMAKRHGKFTWLKSIGLGVLIMLTFFLVFELWFKVQLVKGPLEYWLGY